MRRALVSYSSVLALAVLIIACNMNSNKKAAPAEKAETAIDPVCKMNAAGSDIQYTYNDKLYFFCSEICKEQFAAQPTSYLSTEESASCIPSLNYADSVNMGIITVDTLKGSPRRIACYQDGEIQITVEYGSPGVKERVIWGGLVAYDKVWATGAHHATKINFSKPVTMDGVNIPAGAYAIFTIPGKEEFTFILNKNYQQHLADDYNQSEDVVRINVIPETLSRPVQRLTYELISGEATTGIFLRIAWDKIQLNVPVN